MKADVYLANSVANIDREGRQWIRIRDDMLTGAVIIFSILYF